MRHLLLSFALLSAAGAAFAAGPGLHDPVEVPLIGFKAVINDGRVVSTWKRYKRDDFTAYKLVKSTAEAAPVFPTTAPLYSTLAPGDTEFDDGNLAAGTWHYRLCILTRYGDLWVSPVVTVVVDPGQVRRSTPTVADFE